MRKPNTECSVCGTAIYRRPGELTQRNAVYCSKKCYGIAQALPLRNCEECDVSFKPVHSTQRFCSQKCSAKKLRGESHNPFPARNRSHRNLLILQSAFDFDSCMIEGCDYWQTYDIHRIVEGRNGGEYVIGNMFAICPNHHAEITRGLTHVIKVNDHTLRIIARKRDERDFYV